MPHKHVKYLLETLEQYADPTFYEYGSWAAADKAKRCLKKIEAFNRLIGMKKYDKARKIVEKQKINRFYRETEKSI